MVLRLGEQVERNGHLEDAVVGVAALEAGHGAGIEAVAGNPCGAVEEEGDHVVPFDLCSHRHHAVPLRRVGLENAERELWRAFLPRDVWVVQAILVDLPGTVTP